jgi:RNA polymerase sigma-70 factor (ECF subfamily)
MSSGLAAAFLEALPPGTPAPAGDLEGQIRAFFDAGRQAWPGVRLDAAAFARHLGGLATIASALPPAALAADVYLACACASGAPPAVAAFDRSFSSTIARAVARIDASPAFVEDARQTILEVLLVAAPGAAPRIAEYGGRAPLRVWLHAVAVRAALNLRRRKPDQPHDPLGDEAPEIAGEDPELGYLRSRYKAEFEGAVRTAMGRLSPGERALLRRHLVDGASIDVLAAEHGIGRSTAARRLAGARGALREHTRAELTSRLGLTRSAMDSLAGLLRSRLEVSATGLLAEDPEEPRAPARRS